MKNIEIVVELSKVMKATDDGINAFIAEGLHDLLSSGLGPRDGLPFNWQGDVIFAYHDEVAVGFIHFNKEEHQNSIHIYLGYVKPEYRRHKIYTVLFKRLVEYAKELKVARISGATNVKNTAMRAFYKSVGRAETFVTGSYTVPETLDNLTWVKKNDEKT